MSRFMRRNGLPALVLVAAISTAHAADNEVVLTPVAHGSSPVSICSK